MKNLNNTTQQAKGFIKAYDRATNNGELYEVYGSYSCFKGRALNHCKEVLNALNGFEPKIIGYNSNFFTYAFKHLDEMTGFLKLVVITANNEYAMDYIY